jgi:N-sulfoglucosamine sulfohydrolase
MHPDVTWASRIPAMLRRVIHLCAVSFLAAAGPGLVGAPAASDRPNILFCIADDVSHPHMGAYGTGWVKTPAFDRVARDGILFTRAYTPNAKCAPSRACILTGRNSWQLEAAGNHMAYFPAKFKTYAETLIGNGYFVGLTAKGWAPGDPGKTGDNPRQLLGRSFNQRKMPPRTTGISNNDYAGNFADFMAARPKGQPWCFWYGGTEPHRVYEYGSGIAKGGKRLSDISKVPAFWPDSETVRTDMLDYAFEIEHFDSHLARMLKLLEEQGELDNTLVVVTADNGMPFPKVKGQEYEMSNHLPLAIMWKKGIRNPGRKVDDYVSFIDFAPTFIELAGLKWGDTGMEPAAGRSLTDIFHSDKSGQVNRARDHVLIGKERHDVGRPNDVGYPIRGILKDDLLYLHNFETSRWPAGNPETGYLETDGSPTKTEILELRRRGAATNFWHWSFGMRQSEELYRVQSDPECMENLASNPGFKALKDRLRQALFDELKAQGDPRMYGKGDIFDKYPPFTDAINFHERFSKGEPVKAPWVNSTDYEKGPIK